MKFLRAFCVYVFGGLSYGILELLWRSETHISMFFVGGLCFLTIEIIERYRLFGGSIILQAPLCALCITAVELLSGLLVNRTMHLEVWDYSSLPLNLWGQICLPFSALWLCVSFPAEIAARGIRKYIFGDRLKKIRLLPKTEEEAA